MRVDGSTPSDAVRSERSPQHSSAVQRTLSKPADPTGLTAREARLSSSATIRAVTRAVERFRDTFQRGPSPDARGTTYTASGDVPETPHVISGAFASAKASAAELPQAEIADIQTTASARGLPLISEPYHDGLPYEGLLESTEHEKGLDTLG